MAQNNRFNIGDRVSYYNSYWGRRTGVVAECLGVFTNVDGYGKDNYCYGVTDDVTQNTYTISEKNMRAIRK